MNKKDWSKVSPDRLAKILRRQPKMSDEDRWRRAEEGMKRKQKKKAAPKEETE